MLASNSDDRRPRAPRGAVRACGWRASPRWHPCFSRQARRTGGWCGSDWGALALAAALATFALLGRDEPVFARETLWALALLTAFVCWCGISLLWSIQPDRTWAYLNGGLVYLAFALVGLGIGVYAPRAIERWAYVLAGLVAVVLGWGAAREGGAVMGRLGADRAAQLADRVLERARAPAGISAAPRALARRAARAPSLAAGRRRGVRLRARCRAAVDLLAWRRSRCADRGRSCGSWSAAPRVEGAAVSAARRRGRHRRCGLGVLAARARGGSPRRTRCAARDGRWFAGRVSAGRGSRSWRARLSRLRRRGAAGR